MTCPATIGPFGDRTFACTLGPDHDGRHLADNGISTWVDGEGLRLFGRAAEAMGVEA